MMNLRHCHPINTNLPSSSHKQLDALSAVQLLTLLPALASSDYVQPSDSEGAIPADDWGVLFTGDADTLIHLLIQQTVKTIVNNNDYLKLHSPGSHPVAFM
jgi:hypothetical protein